MRVITCAAKDVREGQHHHQIIAGASPSNSYTRQPNKCYLYHQFKTLLLFGKLVINPIIVVEPG